MNPLMHTDLPYKNKRTGKVRDIYELELDDKSEALLIIATDRLSAFDIVLPDGIPQKGIVLTQISRFWFDYLESDCENHLLSTDVNDLPNLSQEQRDALDGRVMLCKKAKPLPIECIARGYLAGSGWKDYCKTSQVCGIELPEGLTEFCQLPEPLFTPSTKAEVGNDENISYQEANTIVATETLTFLKSKTIELYQKIHSFCLEKGIIIADTKLEFGMIPGSNTPMLIDEIFTPDSSRFWLTETPLAERGKASLDKQYVRTYLEQVQWNKKPPAPNLDQSVIDNTLKRYLDVFQKLTGSPLSV